MEAICTKVQIRHGLLQMVAVELEFRQQDLELLI